MLFMLTSAFTAAAVAEDGAVQTRRVLEYRSAVTTPAEPKRQVATTLLMKFDPVTVSEVPPATGPHVGDNDDTLAGTDWMLARKLIEAHSRKQHTVVHKG